MPKPKFHPFSVSQGKLNNTEMEICWFLPELKLFKWHFYIETYFFPKDLRTTETNLYCIFFNKKRDEFLKK